MLRKELKQCSVPLIFVHSISLKITEIPQSVMTECNCNIIYGDLSLHCAEIEVPYNELVHVMAYGWSTLCLYTSPLYLRTR